MIGTPLRQQYLDIKRRHPDALLLFRIGDFYEAFDDDARLLARELGIVLTSKLMGRNVRVPLAGVRITASNAISPRSSRAAIASPSANNLPLRPLKAKRVAA
jgi:DNA mismatch repair protein MutS